MDQEELLYQIALTQVPGVGNVLAKQLLEYFKTAKNIFEAPIKDLSALHGFGVLRAKAVKSFKNFKRAEEEIKFIEKHQIKAILYHDKRFPRRLKYCIDSPLVLFFKGKVDFNTTKVLSVVGTRHATDYGKRVCERIISDLKDLSILIVSGLAYGMDITAHRVALKNGIPTVGVLAHSLDYLYPPLHAATAKEMLAQGGLLSEYLSGTKPDKQNFPMRNRIVAGLADATLVVETAQKGGSLITAELANGYNRDVFAVPGRTNDRYSEGCHYLIRQNKAALVTNGEDIKRFMGWESTGPKQKVIQESLFKDLDDREKSIVHLLTGKKALPIDEIRLQSKYNSSEIAAAILNLELQGLVQSLPGKLYRLL